MLPYIIIHNAVSVDGRVLYTAPPIWSRLQGF